MRNRRRSSGFLVNLAVLVLAVFPSACFTHRAPPAFTPPPPQAPPVASAVERVPDPPLVASLPDLSDSSGDPRVVPNGVPEAPAPPAPKPPARRPPPVRAAPSPTPQTEQPTQQTPRLGQVLSPDEIRENNRKLDDSLDRVRRYVAALSKKNLTPAQAEILNLVQVFQKQAEEKREQDLVIAVSLAHRADLLAKDLQDRVP